MSVIAGPGVVTSGLVLDLDAGNTKSYPGSGAVWTDISGQGSSCAWGAANTFSTANGGSVTFNGTTGSQFVCGSGGVTGNTARTMSYWWKTTSQDTLAFSLGYSSSTGVPNVALALGAYSNSVTIYGSTGPYDESGISVSTNLIDGTWHDVAITWDGANPGTLNVYANGILVGTRTRTAGKAYATNAGYCVGGWLDNNRMCNGNVALIRVYNRALSAAEISQNFNALRGRFGI